MKILLILAVSFSNLCASEWTDHFRFEKIPNPPGIDPQVGAMEVMKDGRIAVAFHRGEVMIYDPTKSLWSLFASGLHEPLGMLIEDDGSILVMQRPELTRLRDIDGDGVADEYQTVFDDFGMSGNYHEFAYGPARDREGNLYIALGVASNGAPIRNEIRGGFLELGRLNRTEMTEGSDWGVNSELAGRMYSRVPYRGWVLKLSPDGSKMEPFASGFRSPNGIGFDAKGRLLVTDNQGDWRPTSPLYEVKKDGFYGHPAALPWKKDWNLGDPLKVAVKDLDAMQQPAVGFFPQGELANSPTWPVIIPKGVFPEAMVDQTLIGEMNQPTLVRVLDDEVDGKFQTGLVPMFDGSPLGIGNNRMVFGKDGWLYVGKTQLSWAGGNGITRIKWDGKPFLALDKINAVENGFTLSFSESIAPISVQRTTVKRHTYEYHEAYGSPKIDESDVKVRSADLSKDGKILSMDLGKLKEGYLYKIDMAGLRSTSGDEILGAQVWYQVVRSPD